MQDMRLQELMEDADEDELIGWIVPIILVTSPILWITTKL
jgi:hypothetical protein